MTVISDIDDDSATKHGKFHRKKNSGLSPTSPSVKVWFHTLNHLFSGSQLLKSPRMMPTALGYLGQCGEMRCNLSRNRLKVSSGAK